MANEGLYEVCGAVERIVYRNDENDYTVIEIGSGDELITAVGIMPMVCEGEEVRLIGTFKNHSQYGEQLSVTAFERNMPTTVLGILKYLSSGAIKGIGPATAQRLVGEFGEATIEVMENEPERIARLRGISLEKAKIFSEQLRTSTGIRELMLYLGSFGINASQAVNIWKEYGPDAQKILENDPFSLCFSGSGIGFETADLIAKKREFEPDSRVRLRAGLAYVLRHNLNSGHTCLPKDKLISTTAGFLEVEPFKVDSALNEMLFDGTLSGDVFSEREFVFLPDYYKSESYISARMKMLLRFPVSPMKDATEQIELIEKKYNIKYASQQKEAIMQALCRGLLILTGCPGTGKTTTLNGIIEILKKKGLTVLLAAPTGRAAQRMSELTHCEAKTLHRLLEVQWNRDDEPEFKKNEMNMLRCDALIVDELSMVDTMLFESMLKALPLGTRLILVGDSDQLPSVSAGNVLADLIASKVVPYVELNEIFRQSEKSLIITNAHKIVNGIVPELDRKDNDFFFLPCADPEKARDLIVDLYSRRLPQSYGFSPITDIQVLSPARKGPLGTEQLNLSLREAINPHTSDSNEITYGSRTFRIGDKVMQIKNNYDISWIRDNGEISEGIFNGDIGTIVEIDRSSRKMKIRFDDRCATYDSECVADLDLSYACTVHKSQGNEFNAVIMPIIKNSQYLFYRNLLYTGVSRAKKLLIIVGQRSSVEYMVNNNVRTLRYTGLKNMLIRE